MVHKIGEMGFCFGIKNAIKTYEKARKDNEKKRIIFNHPLAHNAKTMEQLIRNNDLHYVEDENEYSKEDILIYSAHGHPLEEEKYEEVFFKTYDAICPFLVSNYKMIEKYSEDPDCDIYFYGDKNHQETKSIISRFDNIVYFDKRTNIEDQLKDLNPKKHVEIFTQSTILEFPKNEIEKFLNSKNVTYHFNNQCKTLINRIEKLLSYKEKIKLNDCIIVVGEKTSSNSNELLRICRMFKCDNVYLISSVEDLKTMNLSNISDFYVVSSTSASEETCEEIIDYLNSL